MKQLIQGFLARLNPKNYKYKPGQDIREYVQQVRRLEGDRKILPYLRSFIIRSVHAGVLGEVTLEDQITEVTATAWSFQSLLYDRAAFDQFIDRARPDLIVDFANYFCILVICGDEEEPYLLDYKYVWETLKDYDLNSEILDFKITEALDFLNWFIGKDAPLDITPKRSIWDFPRRSVSLKDLKEVILFDTETHPIYTHTQTGRIYPEA